MNRDSRQLKSSFLWSAFDSFGTQFLGLFITLTLAKILGPSDYGVVALLTIFIAVSNVFVVSGFNSALIRKQDRSERDFATTFYFSLAVSISCYFVLFFCAPLIASFYGRPEVVALLRVVGLTIIVNALLLVPRTKLTIALDFKTLAKANLVALAVGGATAWILAINEFGAWALVWQQICSTSVNVVLLSLLISWRPKVGFCKKSFRELFGFGSKLLVSGLLDTIFNNIYALVIGKQFSVRDLGLFNQANRLATIPAQTVTLVIQKVTYPLLSEMQDNTLKLESAYLLTLRVAAMIIFPLMLGIAIVAKPLILVLLGEEWLDSANYLSIICISMALYPVHSINLNLLQVKGRTDIFLKLEIIKKVIMTVILVTTIPMGILAICIGMVVHSFLALFVNTYYTGKISSIKQSVQFIALMPIMLISGLSAYIASQFLGYFPSPIVTIVVVSSIALLLYSTGLAIFQKALLLSVIQMVKN